MPAKRATAKTKDSRAKEPAKQGLTKTEACKLLQVAPHADEELVTKAYWHLATNLRVHASRNAEARRKLDELNRAYLVLNPAQSEAPLAKEAPATQEEPQFIDQFFAWVRRMVQQTVSRWPNRAPELAILTGTTVWLALLALSAGASSTLTVIALVLAIVTIWSPWRRSSR